MQGASSTYQPIGRKDLVLRRDLDINDLLLICGKPDKIEDRVQFLKEYATVYPELKLFLVVGYFCRDAFTDLLELGPLDFPLSKVPKGGAAENLKSTWQQVTKMYNTFPAGPRTKRGHAQRLLSELYKEDAKIFKQLIEGKFYDERINELVVKQAFPELCPNG